MVDQERRDQLLAMKLTALVREHDPTAELQSASFGFGAAALDGRTGWVLLEDRPRNGLGAALAWALRAGADRVQVLASEGTGTLARRAAAFAIPIEVWHVADRALIPAIAEPLPVPPPVPAEHDSFRELIVAGGATPVIEDGALVGEVRGLEVCRVVTDSYTGAARLEVGIGRNDREAFQMLHGDVPTVEALTAVVARVAPHRLHGADPHPLNRLGQERALRARLIDEPQLVGATQVEASPPPVPRANLKDPQPSVARAEIDGQSRTLVISTGVDLDLVPFATDARLASGLPATIVVPRRDALPVQRELAALLRDLIPIVTVG